MIESTLQCNKSLHVGMIMDGNGRWAQNRDLPRIAGHLSGVDTIGPLISEAPALGISMLSLYAFSADNWRRPPDEVAALMALFEHYLDHETDRYREKNIRLTFIGRRDRLAVELVEKIEHAEYVTAQGTGLHLRIAIDYSSRAAIAHAAARVQRDPSLDPDQMLRVFSDELDGEPAARDIDLLIRTGGEQRLSDFLLWECAYAELLFSARMWPEFTADDLGEAVTEFHKRERRFGRLPHKAGPGLVTETKLPAIASSDDKTTAPICQIGAQ